MEKCLQSALQPIINAKNESKVVSCKENIITLSDLLRFRKNLHLFMKSETIFPAYLLLSNFRSVSGKLMLTKGN